MKKVQQLCSLVLCLGLLCYQSKARDDSREHSKMIEETFPLEQGGELTIVSMHGRIDVATWDREEVKIEVLVRTQARNDRKGRDILDRINVDFSSASSYVRAETEIKSSKSMWWFVQDWFGEADIQIDYEVFMPKEADLEIEHRYGKIDIQDIVGDVKVDLRHGDLEVDQVGGQLELKLTHGDGVIARANSTEVDMSYYKLRMNDANVVEVDASFSRLNLASANEVRARSGNTKYFLGDIGSLDFENKYGTLEIDQLEGGVVRANRCDVDIDYLTHHLALDIESADLHIERTSAELERIDIEGTNAGLSFDLQDVRAYLLDVDCDFTTVDLPSDLVIEDESDHHDVYKIKAFKGSSTTNTTIEVVSEHGGLKIR